MTSKDLRTRCPTDIAVQILANKWTIIIVRELMSGTKRPSDLEKRLRGISAKTLSERLHDLQSLGLVERQTHPEVPPRVEYSLTELGMHLDRLMLALKEFGMLWQIAMDEDGYRGDRCKECPNFTRVEYTNEVCPSVADLNSQKKKRKKRN